MSNLRENRIKRGGALPYRNLDQRGLVPGGFEKPLDVLARQHERRGVHERVTPQPARIPHVPIDHELHLLRSIVDQCENCHGPRRDAEVPLQPIGRSEAQVVAANPRRERAQIDGLGAVRDHEPVPMSLLVTDEQVLRVHGIARGRHLAVRLLTRENRGVLVALVRDAERCELAIEFFGGQGTASIFITGWISQIVPRVFPTWSGWSGSSSSQPLTRTCWFDEIHW